MVVSIPKSPKPIVVADPWLSWQWRKKGNEEQKGHADRGKNNSIAVNQVIRETAPSYLID